MVCRSGLFFGVIAAFVVGGCLAPPADVDFDAGPPIDAEPQLDAASGEITVLVTTGTIPRIGVPVIVHDVNGDWLETLHTDDAGRVVRDVAAGSAITIVHVAAAGEGELTTVFGVEPGDVLTFDEGPLPPVKEDVAYLTRNWTAPADCVVRLGADPQGAPAPAPPTTTWTTFGSSYNGTNWYVANCTGDGPTSWSAGSVDFMPGVYDYFLTFNTFSPAESRTQVTFEGLPAEGRQMFKLDSVGSRNVYWSSSATTTDGAIWERVLPAVTLDSYREHVAVYVDEEDAVLAHGYTTSTSTPRDDVTEELEDWLPMIRVVERVTDPAGRHTLRWEPLSPMPARVDGQLTYRDGWTMVLPPDATSLRYPELPAEFAQLRENLRPAGNVKAIDASNIVSYRDFRSGLYTARDQGFREQPLLPEAPMRGVRWEWAFGKLTTDIFEP